jgi:hypothetical protein
VSGFSRTAELIVSPRCLSASVCRKPVNVVTMKNGYLSTASTLSPADSACLRTIS